MKPTDICEPGTSINQHWGPGCGTWRGMQAKLANKDKVFYAYD